MGDENETVWFNIRIRVIDKISPSLVGKSVLLVAEYDDAKIFGTTTAVIKMTEETDEKTKRLEKHHKVEWDSPPIFDFAMEAKKSKLLTSKSLCSIGFKMRQLDLKKKTQKTIAKWKVDLYRFYKKTEFVNTALIKSDTKPRIIINVVDVNELAKKKKTGPIDSRMNHIDFTAKPELVEKKKGLFGSKKKKKDDDSDSDDEECKVEESEGEAPLRKNSSRRLSMSHLLGKDKDKSEKSKEDSSKEEKSKKDKAKKGDKSERSTDEESHEGKSKSEKKSTSEPSFGEKKEPSERNRDKTEESSDSKRHRSSSSSKDKRSSRKLSKGEGSEDSDNPLNWASETDSEVSASIGAYKVEDIPSEEESSEKVKRRSSSKSIERKSSSSSLQRKSSTASLDKSSDKKSSHEKKDKVATTEPSSSLFSLDSIVDDGTEDPSAKLYKVIIIGDSAVGKSQLLGQWVHNQFSKDILPTVYIEFSTKMFKVEGKMINVQFWDTAGQERFNALTRQYYNGAHGAVIVYSIAERHTFDAVEKWLKDIRAQSQESEILLVGNKSDLESKRKVSTKEAMDYAKSKKLSFLETSALDGSNCHKAMQIILQDIHKKQKKNSMEDAQLSKSANSPSKNKPPSQVIKIEAQPEKSSKSHRHHHSSSSKSTPVKPSSSNNHNGGSNKKAPQREESSEEEATATASEESEEKRSGCEC